jgi:hypothetical protein
MNWPLRASRARSAPLHSELNFSFLGSPRARFIASKLCRVSSTSDAPARLRLGKDLDDNHAAAADDDDDGRREQKSPLSFMSLFLGEALSEPAPAHELVLKRRPLQ